MNNRIEALWLEAHKRGGIVGIEEIEKFAELIIKECAKVMNDNDFDDSTIGDCIKEHFGVE
jgi:hypothetical protein